MIDLAKQNVRELKALAKTHKVKNWWTLTREELLAELEEIQAKLEPDPVPIQKPKRGELIHYNGKAQNLCAWAEELGINPNTLYGRLYKLKWPIERALTVKK